ncbi:hypothetical protein [Stackebrandtia soli]|uniref:hypothetical protein n=1 Tax=Stackebrandtia soli TaxID=1892856 RepID=UPI0039ECD04E
MTNVPQHNPVDEDDDDPTGNFYFGIGMAIVGVLLAIGPHTEIWADQFTTDATGRRAGFTRLIASIDRSSSPGSGSSSHSSAYS